jgi:hypothetical protein
LFLDGPSFAAKFPDAAQTLGAADLIGGKLKAGYPIGLTLD